MGNLLQHFCSRDLIGQRGDHDDTIFDLESRTHPDAAAACLVEAADLVGRGDNLCISRKIRSEHMLAKFCDRRLRRFKQAYARAGDLAYIVRGNVSRHADSDARRAIQQHIGQTRRQQRRLTHGAIEVRQPLDGALPQFRQQHRGVACELGLGVTHGGEGLRVIN